MGLIYDFAFAELAIKFLETDDANYLKTIAELDATEHIFSHALQFNYDMPSSKLEFVTGLLTPCAERKEALAQVIKNIDYAKKHIVTGIAEKITLQFLPKNFSFSSSLFFTFGYDIGVAYGNNCSLNLAHPIFSNNKNEIKYYAIHELHHAGFIMLKGGYMPSLKISSRKEMAHIIEYLTHLEGMGTYAALEMREQENAMNAKDYIALQDPKLMDSLIKEYFNIYHYFKNNPDEKLVEEDWHKIEIMSDIRRLWYKVGAHIAKTIDQQHGREYLTSLIAGLSENFLASYSNLTRGVR